MGDELRGILESQRQLETRFDQLRVEGGGGGGGDRATYLRDQAHSLAATSQSVYEFITSAIDIITSRNQT